MKESLKELVKNKYFVFLAIGTILYNLSAAPVATYYAKYVFGDINKTALINLPGMLAIFILPFAVPFINKFGKRNCIVGGMLLAAASHIVIFFANTNLAMFMIGKSIGGIAVVPFTVALIPMTGEICDYALYRSKKPMDGTISSAATMGGKIGIGLAAGLSSMMLALGGYISTDSSVLAVQPDSAIFMIRVLAGIYPAVMYILAAICFWKIDLEKKGITEIQKELKEQGLR